MLSAPGCVGPAATGKPYPRAGYDPASDPALFSAVVARIVADARGVPVRVDPRPLLADPAIIELVPGVAAAVPDLVAAVPHPLASVSTQALHERSRALARLHVAEGDAFAFGGCPGVLVPPELQANRPSLPGCPNEAFIGAIVGIARPGGAYWAGSRVDRRASAGEGVWTARVIRRHLRPIGASATALDYEARRLPDGTWTVVRVVPLLVLE
jgi:hypothetical protein